LTGQDTNGDGVGDTQLPHLGLDNFPLVAPWVPGGLSASLAGRAAWAAHPAIHGSHKTQTLAARATNTGTAPVWVEVVFKITTPQGTTTQLTSQPFWLETGATTDLSVSFQPAPGRLHCNCPTQVQLRRLPKLDQRWNQNLLLQSLTENNLELLENTLVT